MSSRSVKSKGQGKEQNKGGKTSSKLDVNKLIHDLPKSDLHLHLDGSVDLATMIQIAKAEKIKLPSYTVDGLNTVLFKDHYASLEEYLTTFGYSCSVMQKPEHLEQISYELVKANIAEGVRYIEVRYAPQLHINKYMSMKDVLVAVDKGLKRGKDEFNRQPKIMKGEEPPFDYGIIVCAMRMFGGFSEYFTKFLEAHPFSKPKKIYGMCSMELAQGAVKYRDELGLPIVAFDLAGAEKGFPAADHKQAYEFAHANFMHKTVHAGEAYGPESIFQAISDLQAERIGHGYYLFDTSKITEKSIKDKETYVRQLSQYIADRRITIEVCLTSNMQTNPEIKHLKNHAFRKMMENGLSTSFCTDNRTVSKTTVSREISLALENFDIDWKALKNTLVYGFKRSFHPGTYMQKRAYVRGIIDYTEKVFARHGIELP
jgi:adenosine deaminase